MNAATDQAFIVGFNLSSIDTDVRRELGWKRMSRDSWQDDDGRLVKYLSEPHRQLAGLPKGALVYLAPGFDQRENWWQIDDAMRMRDCERIYL